MIKNILARLAFRLRKAISIRLKVPVRNSSLYMRTNATNIMEYVRFSSFFSKEEGTVAWLDETLDNDSVLLDIGANIGIYSIYSALKINVPQCVYSIEPNAYSFHSLLTNIKQNSLIKEILPINIALTNRSSIFNFYYNSNLPGHSGSQVNSAISEHGETFIPVATELKLGYSIDELCDKGLFKRRITHVKIDVDGHEKEIVEGMATFLGGSMRPNYVQIEINPGAKSDIDRLMESFGYKLSLMSDTLSSKKIPSLEISQTPHNALYVPIAK